MPGSMRPAVRPPRIGAAPGELETVRAFVNTRDIEAGTDELATPAGLADWLASSGLLLAPGQVTRVTSAELKQAVTLRECLRGILRSHLPATGGLAGDRRAEATRELRQIAAVLPVRLEAGHDGRVAAVPAGSGTSAGLARLLLIAARSDAVGTWQRLKACGADDCQWAFYDRSPTQNGCWCTMQLCGARAKSRAYRRRAGSSPRPRRAPAAG